MNRRISAVVLGIVAVVAVAALRATFPLQDESTLDQSIAPEPPVGRKLTESEQQLSGKATEQLAEHFPAYRLPLDQDRTSGLLRDAITRKDVDQVQRLINSGADVNWQDGHDLPLLFVAIQQNEPSMVDSLIRAGAAVTPGQTFGYGRRDLARNAWEQTPIYFAARLGHRHIVDLLLGHGADVNSANGYGKSAIAAALERCDRDLFDYLLTRDATCDFDRQIYPDPRTDADSVLRTAAKKPRSPFPEKLKRYWKLKELGLACNDPELSTEIEQLAQQWREDHPLDPSKDLRQAVLFGRTEEVRDLLNRGAKPTEESNGSSLLHLAAGLGHTEICKILIDAGLDVSKTTTGHQRNQPIHSAIASGSVPTIKLLRARGAKLLPWGDGKVDRSPLSRAVSGNHPEMVQYLIDAGESPHEQEVIDAAMALTFADSYGTGRARGVEIAEILIDAGVDLDFEMYDFTPELRVARNGQLDLFQLIEQKKAVSYDDNLLRAAVDSGNIDLIRHVVAKGARLDPDLEKNEMLLRIALVKHRDPELIELLFEIGVARVYPRQFDVSTGHGGLYTYGHPLYNAALMGDIDFCRYLMRTFPADQLWQPLLYEPYEYDNDIEYFSKGNTPLFAPLFGDHVEILELFLTDGFKTADGKSLLEIEAGNWIGATALHEAVNFAAPRCAQLLLAFGADPLVQRTNDGNTPLHLAIHHAICAHSSPSWAVEREKPRIFPMLAAVAEAGDADWVNIRNKKNETILHQFARAINLGICKSLVALGADVNAVDEDGETPLYFALTSHRQYYFGGKPEQRTELALFLAESGTDLQQPGVTPYQKYYAAAAGNRVFEFCDYLSAKGIEPDIQQNQGRLMCSAAGAGQARLVNTFLEMGADIDATDAYAKKTPLHHAVLARDLQMCRMLIDLGADVNAQDRDGYTPLFSVFDRYGAYIGRFMTPDPEKTRKKAFEVLNLLLAFGADPSIRSSDGKTVMQTYASMPQEFIERLRAARIAE